MGERGGANRGTHALPADVGPAPAGARCAISGTAKPTKARRGLAHASKKRNRRRVQEGPLSPSDAPNGAPSPTDWSARYAAADTPWDNGAPHPELSLRLQDGRLAPPHDGARVLVPGAGRGHDAIALARRGWDVTAVDIVGALEAEVAPPLAKLGSRFMVADVLGMDHPHAYDLVWDHTFFCAIHPEQRAEWGAQAGRLLKPGGHYAALVFPVGRPAEAGGPPFGMDCEALRSALGRLFHTRESEPATRTLKRRQWREFWYRAERTVLAPAQ